MYFLAQMPEIKIHLFHREIDFMNKFHNRRPRILYLQIRISKSEQKFLLELTGLHTVFRGPIGKVGIYYYYS